MLLYPTFVIHQIQYDLSNHFQSVPGLNLQSLGYDGKSDLMVKIAISFRLVLAHLFFTASAMAVAIIAPMSPRYSTPLILATLSISTLVPTLPASYLPVSGMVFDGNGLTDPVIALIESSKA